MKIAILLVFVLTITACTGQATNSLGTPTSCSDTDGGKTYDQSGTVMTKSSSGEITTHPDKCENGKLIENYCDGGNYPRQEIVSCNCYYGICI